MSKPGLEKISRRQAIAASVVGAAGLSVVTAQSSSASGANGANGSSGASAREGHGSGASGSRLPVAFVPHGGGPWPFVDLGMPAAEVSSLASYLRSVSALPKTTPKALLIVSAHWEERVPTVLTSARPPILYDYFGFPEEAYAITWPAPGDPALAARVRTLLGNAGIDSASDPTRGFDHGAFIPFKLTYPNADIPTIQLSLKAGLDPAEHIAMGRALAPLRDEGVFIVGSGMSYHNMRGFFGRDGNEDAIAFDTWLQGTATKAQDERDRGLVAWASAPSARRVHPREEHLLPLMVVAGAAGADRASVGFVGTMGEKRISAYHFG